LESESNRCGSSAQEGEGDDGFAGIAGFGEEIFFEFVRGMHFAGGDLVFSGSDEAEFAAGECITVGDADGRAEDATGHGTEGVDVAEAGFGVESGAGYVIGEVLEAGLIGFGGAEDAGSGIAGEGGGVLVEPGFRAASDGLSGVGVGSVERLHAGLETSGVEGIDGKDAVTALRASGSAGEP